MGIIKDIDSLNETISMQKDHRAHLIKSINMISPLNDEYNKKEQEIQKLEEAIQINEETEMRYQNDLLSQIDEYINNYMKFSNNDFTNLSFTYKDKIIYIREFINKITRSFNPVKLLILHKNVYDPLELIHHIANDLKYSVGNFYIFIIDFYDRNEEYTYFDVNKNISNYIYSNRVLNDIDDIHLLLNKGRFKSHSVILFIFIIKSFFIKIKISSRILSNPEKHIFFLFQPIIYLLFQWINSFYRRCKYVNHHL